MHLWRQTDCLSMTENYMEGAPFLEPQMHLLLGDDLTTGKSAGEFPILYYTMGKVWSVVGKSYTSFRIFYFIFLFIGLFSLFKTLLLFFKNSIVPTIIPLLLFTSPTYVYYSVNFLTDAPSISFSLLAVYFFCLYLIKDNKKMLYYSMVVFAFAGLLKVSSLIPFCVILGLYSIDYIWPLKENERLFKDRIRVGLSFAIVFVAVGSWMVYIKYYNNLHGFKYTFNHIYPIWEAVDSMPVSIEGVVNTTSKLFFNRSVLFLLMFVSIINLFLFKRMARTAYVIFVLTLFGSMSYFVLWGPLFGVHDYYYMPFMFLVLCILIPFLFYVQKVNYSSIRSYSFHIFAIVFLSYNFIYCNGLLRARTNRPVSGLMKAAIADHSLVNLVEWFGRSTIINELGYERAKPYLKKIGVSDDSKVISMSDVSFSITLYFMDKDGWTNYSNYQTEEDIQNLIDHGAEFLMVNDTELENMKFLAPFTKNEIGRFEKIRIFKL